MSYVEYHQNQIIYKRRVIIYKSNHKSINTIFVVVVASGPSFVDELIHYLSRFLLEREPDPDTVSFWQLNSFGCVDRVLTPSAMGKCIPREHICRPWSADKTFTWIVLHVHVHNVGWVTTQVNNERDARRGHCVVCRVRVHEVVVPSQSLVYEIAGESPRRPNPGTCHTHAAHAIQQIKQNIYTSCTHTYLS